MPPEQEAEVETAFERLKYSAHETLRALQARIHEIRIKRIEAQECRK